MARVASSRLSGDDLQPNSPMYIHKQKSKQTQGGMNTGFPIHPLILVFLLSALEIILN